MRIENTPRGLLTLFFRQKMKFVLTFWLVLAAGCVFAALSVPHYESTGALLVKFGGSATSLEAMKTERSSQTEISQTGHEIIESYTEILQSNGLLMKLINEFGPANIYPELAKEDLTGSQLTEAAMKKLKRDLAIKSGDESDIIDISVLNSDPKMAAQLIHHLQELFIALQTDVYNKPQTEFISEQVQQASAQLAQDQEKLQTFKAKAGVSAIDPEISSLLEEKNSVKSATLDNVNEAQLNLDQLKAKEAQLLTTYKADSAPVVQIQHSIAFAESQLNDRKRTLSGASSQGGALASMAIDSRITHLEAKRSEYNDLTRQVQIDADTYKNFLAQLENAKLNEKLNQENITRVVVLDEPIIASKPSKPSRILIVAFSLMAGLVLGMGAVIAAEVMDERFSAPGQLAAILKIPALAMTSVKLNRASNVPRISDRNHVRSNAGKDVDDPANAILNPMLPTGDLMELYNTIKNALPDRPSRIVQFASAYNQEGANLIAFDMATIVATRTPLRVLFVDTSTESQGIRRQLAQAVDALPDASIRNSNPLGVAPAAVVIGTNLAYTTLRNRGHDNEPAFNDPQATSALLDSWRKVYDLVVIPSPAIMANVSCKALTKLTDGCVLVVEADRTRAPVAMQTQNMIHSHGGRVVCAILNKRNFYIPKWLYRALWL